MSHLHHPTLLHNRLPYFNRGLVRNGLVAEYRFDESKNLLKYSQQFDNAEWTKTDCAIAANDTAAPDGTTTADKVTLTVGAAQSIAGTYTVVAATAYTFSIWVKLGTATALKYAIYDVSNSGDITAATSYSATTSWARYTATFTTPAGCTSVSIRPVKDSAQDNGTTAWIWGAQLEQGSVARTYYPTRDKQLLMDYSRPRKNLLLPNQANSCEDGAVPFTKLNAGDTLSASAGEVDEWQGTYCLKVVTGNATTNEGFYTEVIYGLRPSSSYIASGYIRGASGGETVKLVLRETTDAGSEVDNTLSSTLTLTTEWQRVTVSRTFGTTGRGARLLVYTPTQQNIVFYVDGLQLEEGSTATAWEAPPNIGILGSTTGSDTNDPTYTGTGASFTTDDYIGVGAVNSGGNLYHLTLVFYTAQITTSTTSEAICGIRASTSTSTFSSIQFGASTGDVDNELIAVIHKVSDTLKITAWCEATTIAAGWHTLTINWNGSSYDIYVDQVKKTTTPNTNGHATIIPMTNVVLGARQYNSAIISFFAGTLAYANIYSRALTQAEITQNYNYLKGYLLRERGISI